LRTLHVRVGRHQYVERSLGAVDQDRRELVDGLERFVGLAARPQPEIRRDLVVPRSPGVELAAHRPGDLAQPGLDVHVHVLLGGIPLERAGLDLLCHLLQTRDQRRCFVVGEHAGSTQAVHVRLRSAYVLAP
jgi:hypothetical protein